MKKIILLFVVACSVFAFGQTPVTNITTGSACAPIDVTGKGTASISITGSGTGTLLPEIAIGGDPPATATVYPSTAPGSGQTTITASGSGTAIYDAPVSAKSLFLVCPSGTITGTITVRLSVAVQSASSHGGAGGSGLAGVATGTGSGLAGGCSGTGNTCNISIAPSGVTNAMLANPFPASATILGSNGSSAPVAAALPSGDVYIGSSGNLPVAQTISQDASVTTAGAWDNVGLLTHALPSLATGNLNWNGSAWNFSAAGAGTVTSVASGTGLTGGPITGSGTLALVTPVSVANGGTGTATPGLVAGTNVTITGSWPGQTINATGGGSLPSGSQGEPAINQNGSTTYATNTAPVDASSFTGADACAKIATAIAAQQGGGGAFPQNGGGILWPVTGQQTCAASPFANSNQGGDILLEGNNQEDIRTSVSWVIPGGTHLHGQGPGGNTTSSNGTANNMLAANYYNTIIRACNPKIFNCTTAFAVPTDTITGISVTGTTATVTANNALKKGQEVVINNTTNNALGVTGQFYSSFVLLAGLSATQFEITVPSGTGNCSSACGTAYEATPLITFGGGTFRTEIDHLTLDCAFVVGCIPFINYSGQENSIIHDVNMFGSGLDEWGRVTSTAISGTTGGGIHSGDLARTIANVGVESCELTTGPSNCFSAVGIGGKVDPVAGTYPAASLNAAGLNPYGCDSRGIVLDGIVSGATGGPLFGVSAFTLNTAFNNAGILQVPVQMNSTTCAGHAPVGILIENIEVKVQNFHVEWWLQPILIGGNVSINPDYPNVATQNVKVDSFEVCCGGTANAVEIGPNALDITVSNWDANTGNPLHDAVAGNTCTGESQEGYYVLGNNANQVWTTCTGVTNSTGALALTGDLSLAELSSGSIGVASKTIVYAQASTHRPLFNPGNTGALNFVGIASAGTAGHSVNLATNGIDIVDSGGSSLISPMTTLGDSIYGGAGGAATRLAGPTTPNGVAQVWTDTPSGGAAVAQAWSLPGVIGRAVTTTSTDTIASTDCSPKRIEYLGSGATPITLPTATTLAVTNCVFRVANNLSSVADLTVTTTTWTCNGAATCVIHNGQIATFYVDPNSTTNWVADITEQGLTAGSNVTFTRSATGLSIAASGGGSSVFPLTVSGAVTSGGVAYFNSATQESSSPAGTINTLMKWGGAGNPPIASSITDNGTIIQTTEPFTTSYVGTASQSSLYATGAPFAGTGTTSFPLFYLDAGAIPPTTLSTGGTFIGVNSQSGFAGNEIGIYANGTAEFTVNASGVITTGSLNALTQLPTQAANTVLGNFMGSTATPTATAVASCSGANDAEIYTTSTGFGCGTNFVQTNQINTGTSAMTLNMNASTTAASVNLPAVIGGTQLSGTSTMNLSAPAVIQNTNSTNNNTSITLGVSGLGTSTGETVLNVNCQTTGSDCFDIGTGGSWTAGVLSAQTNVFAFSPAGKETITGTGAGFFQYGQGSTQSTGITAITEQAPTAVTSYLVTKPGTAAQGITVGALSGTTITQGFSGDANHSATVSWSTATTIGSTSLCSTTFCPAGTYRVSVYIDVTTACTTTGSYVVNLIWTDDSTVSKTSVIPLAGLGMTSTFGPTALTGTLVPTSTTDFGTGSFILRSTGTTSINYSTTAGACATGGPGVGKLYLTVEPIQ